MSEQTHNAYTVLLMHHSDMLWRMCWHRAGGDRDRSRDLFQEVSIALWENFDKLRPDANPGQERAWVRWQARSVFYQIERHQKLTTVPLNSTITDRMSDNDKRLQYSSDGDNGDLQRKELIEELLSSLDPDEQRMVRLYLEGYHGDEIGEKMGISRDNVYQRMHRAIQKMRLVALISLALLFTSALAVAVVPQWRHFIYSRGSFERTDTDTDTIPAQPDSIPATTTPFPDTLATFTDGTLQRRGGLNNKMEPVERMPQLSLTEYMNASEELHPLVMKDSLAISVNGNRIFITGAEGEIVRVYDIGGKLVAAQKASRFCPIDLFPNTNSFGSWSYQFYLQIGNRPTILLTL